MKILPGISLVFVLVLAACGSDDAAPPSDGARQPDADAPAAMAGDPADEAPAVEAVEIAPGLTRRILEAGDGPAAEAGQTAVVHYTGWLYDESAPDHRGTKFDSSVDRGEHFEFPIGAGRVIRGWDLGVAGMRVGEVRELTIAPDLAYGDRGAGTVIPPGATLVFEVELAGLKGGAAEPAPGDGSQ